MTRADLDAMEADRKAHGDTKAMDCVRRLYAKWNAAVYDADKVRAERDRAEREWHAATARADKAEALLMEARDEIKWWAEEHSCCAGDPTNLLPRIDKHMKRT
jgi:seryl-tRNA synthetase